MIRPDTLAFRTLAAMARQRPEMSGTRCGAVMDLLHAAFVLQAALRRQLDRAQLSDLKLAVLAALYALDPNPVPPRDLSFYTGFTRAAVNGAVDDLAARQLIGRERDPTDRRMHYLRLTGEGRRLGERAALTYLRAVDQMARTLEPSAVSALQRACTHLAGCAARLSSRSPSPSP